MQASQVIDAGLDPVPPLLLGVRVDKQAPYCYNVTLSCHLIKVLHVFPYFDFVLDSGQVLRGMQHFEMNLE